MANPLIASVSVPMLPLAKYKVTYIFTAIDILLYIIDISINKYTFYPHPFYFLFGIPHICSVLWFPAYVFLRIVICFYTTVFLPRFLLLGMTKQFSCLPLKCLLFSDFAHILHLPHFLPRAARILGALKIGFCALVGFFK